MQQTPVASPLWGHVASRVDAVAHPNLLEAVLTSGDDTAVAAVIAAGRLSPDEELRAARVLVPRSGVVLSWAVRQRLVGAQLAPGTQLHLARTLGLSLEFLWELFTDSAAVAVIVGRALPKKPPLRVEKDGNREPASPAAVPLIMLSNMIDRTTDLDEQLLACGFLDRAAQRLAEDYTTATAYVGRVAEVVVSFAQRHQHAFLTAVKGRDLPGYMLRKLATEGWIDDDTRNRIYDTYLAVARTEPENPWPAWQTLRHLEPRLDEHRREELRTVLRVHGEAVRVSPPYATWVTQLLTPPAVDGDWTRAPLPRLLRALRDREYAVGADDALPVLGRADLPHDVAVRVAASQPIGVEVVLARDDEFAIEVLSDRPVAQMVRLLWGDDDGASGRWGYQGRVDLIASALGRKLAALGVSGSRDSVVPALVTSRVAEKLGDRVLSFPWWAVGEWAGQEDRVGDWVGEAVLEAMAEPVVRDVLLRMAVDAQQQGTAVSLLDLIDAATATAG